MTTTSDPIRNVIAQAGRRLLLARWIRQAVVLLTIAGVLALLARGTEKLFPVVTVEWAWVLPALAGTAVLLGLLIAAIRRPSEEDIARTIDERADLHESISTALCVEDDHSPWARAIVSDAGHRASRVVVRDTVPIEAPGNSWWPVVACAALLAVWWLPATDVAGLLARQEADQAAIEEVREVAAEVDNAQRQIEKILSDAGVEIDEDSGALEDLFNPNEIDRVSPEEMQRAAIKQLTKLSDTLAEQRNGEEGMTFDAIKDAMNRMEQPEPGPATEMSKAMARGDFAEARKQLEQLAKQIASGEMPEDQKQQLQEQLEKMSEAMAQMAENREQLEEQLREAGLSEAQAQQLASDPNALEEALKEQGLDQEQIDQLKQQAQAQQNASDAASAMSQAMGQMAQGMQNESEGQMGEGLDSMSGQLSSLEQMQSEMQALDQAMSQAHQSMSECSNPGDGQGDMFGEGSQWGENGQFAQGDSMRQGSGSGKAGQGLGVGPDEQPTDFVLKNEKANVNTTDQGPVIASTLVYGSQVRGESTATFSSVVQSAEAEAAEAIETKRVPREHEQAVKAYFGRLQEAAAKEEGKNAKPAEAGSDADAGSGSGSGSSGSSD
ncbi:MAG: hypothetical protein AAGA55_07250 [Planctomycetota bacterium]